MDCRVCGTFDGFTQFKEGRRAINQTTEDEDKRAEFANDLVGLGMTKRQVVKEAVEVFGAGVNLFGRTAA